MNDKITERTELIEVLRKAFPQMWLRLGEQFNREHTGTIWTGEGSQHGDLQIFNYNARDNEEKTYKLGILKKLTEILAEHNWYAQWHDRVTVFFHRI